MEAKEATKELHKEDEEQNAQREPAQELADKQEHEETKKAEHEDHLLPLEKQGHLPDEEMVANALASWMKSSSMSHHGGSHNNTSHNHTTGGGYNYHSNHSFG